jgi:Transcription factor WhiB
VVVVDGRSFDAYQELMREPHAPELPDLAALLQPPDWHAYAACRGLPTEAFLGSASAVDVARAKARCAGCAVLSPCLAAAKADRSLEGIWGGTTWEERWQPPRIERRAARGRAAPMPASEEADTFLQSIVDLRGEGLSLERIGRRLDRSEGWVGTRLAEARRRGLVPTFRPTSDGVVFQLGC